MEVKAYTLKQLSELVSKDIDLDLSFKWDVHVDFYKNSDNYIFKFSKKDGN